MNTVLFAILIVSGIGIVCAVVLAIASKVMAVEEDEKFTKIRECLPGANCGACGYTGCDGYAHALAENDGIKTNLCVPGADNTARQIAEVLGVEFEDVMGQVAVVHCKGDCNATQDKMDYEGIHSCAAVKMLFGGKGSCTFGCIGLGDCAKSCPNEAICIKNGIAHIDTRRCIGCGICAKTCPNSVITIMDDVKSVVVSCNNKEKGAQTRKKCTNGCIGCKKCEKACDRGAIKVENNLAAIDNKKCVGCENMGVCVEACPTGAIGIRDLT